MQKLDLGGSWILSESGSKETMEGVLPGCNYLDLIRNRKISDPFWGTNEEKGKEIAEKDWEYRRYFNVSDNMFMKDKILLDVSGIDTIAIILLNENKIAETDNAHRSYQFDVKQFIKEKDNLISILFKAPMPYVREKNKENPMPGMSVNVKGVSHLRKPQCHFGWDWGPTLPPSGVTGHIGLIAYNTAKFKEVRVNQKHGQDLVTLNIHTEIEINDGECCDQLFALCRVHGPKGESYESKAAIVVNSAENVIQIFEPQLWWSNGLGEQPLYEVQVSLWDEENILDTWSKNIGLRTIELDTSPDQWGRNFQFLVNGVPIFAKGADWIPSDSFVSRTSEETLEFYIKSAKEANMNMLRVWGGGYYESDTFYEFCDKYGILVWQDFGFACMSYLLSDEAFVDNVKHEVFDNVRRLRHHASLALWCGNNEIEFMDSLWKKNKVLYNSGRNFFHKLLPEWVAQLDDKTPYWPGSPSSGTIDGKPNDITGGDTHLWQVWHGMLPIESFSKYPTRFCSEFGMESLPSMSTVKSFTDDLDLNIFKPVMLAHQKSIGGNQKMLFYLLSKYRNPSTFKDFIYLSQLIQSETIRCATEEWRRNTGRCNGALYWQYNDCWPVASWAGIDYGRQFKAVQYRARHFNQMCCVSAAISKRKAEIYCINDYPSEIKGTLKWELADFDGRTISSGSLKVNLSANKATKVTELNYDDILAGHKKNEVVLVLNLLNEKETISKQTCLLVPDKKASLRKPHIKKSLKVIGETAELILETNTFARYVFVEIDGITTPLSDNYFDIEGGKSYSINFTIPENMDLKALEENMHIHSLADVITEGSLFHDKCLRMAMRLKKENLITWLIFKFI